jgi:hypothetical protein
VVGGSCLGYQLPPSRSLSFPSNNVIGYGKIL